MATLSRVPDIGVTMASWRDWRTLALALCVSVSGLSRVAHAQNGALYLLVPFGARAVAQGEAVAADSSLGSEGIWWNPASLARMTKQELAIHHSATVVYEYADMLTYVRPSRVLGTLAASAYIVNYGDQDATDINGQPVGTITNRNYQLAVSYATPMGKRLSAGLTYKFVMLRFQCTGTCGDQPIISGATSALDAGVQYALPTSTPVMIGLSLRNIGPALQVKDAAQADPLPRVIQAGIRARIPSKSLAERKATIDVSADIVNAPALNGGAGGVGATLTYDRHYLLRTGYKLQPGAGKGPSLGFGYEGEAFGLDLAQRYDAISAQSGKSATYVSLRARF
jgi:hypothetical protein